MRPSNGCDSSARSLRLALGRAIEAERRAVALLHDVTELVLQQRFATRCVERVSRSESDVVADRVRARAEGARGLVGGCPEATLHSAEVLAELASIFDRSGPSSGAPLRPDHGTV